MNIYEELAAALLARVNASRVTVRLCEDGSDPLLVAEALAPGIPSMAGGPVTGIREAGTYVFLEKERRILVQNDCRAGEPTPPPSLIETYRVYAQMLAPVIVRGEMVGTISVHQQDRSRVWTKGEIGALADAQMTLEAELTGAGPG